MKNKQNMHGYCTSWYKTPAGKASLGKVDDFCTDILSETFGYYAIQIGFLSGDYNLLKNSRITAGFSIATENKITKVEQTSAVSSIEHLPIATDNVDLVVASHVLELSNDPHQVLREIDRVLVPDGDCILIGFNPYSISRIKDIFGALLPRNIKSRNKKDYKMRSVSRVRDWFSLLGFEVIDVNYLGMRSKLTDSSSFKSMNLLERLKNYASPFMGTLYVLHVKKQVIKMRPYKKVWRAPAVLHGGKVAINRTAQRIRRENYSTND